MENPQTAFVTIVPALFICAVTVFAPSIIPDGDPYWHIAAGRWMIQHLTVPYIDPFSYTFAGAPWDAHEWLSEVIMGAVYQWAGWSGIYLLFGLAIGLTSFAIARTLLRFMDPVPAFFFLQLALIALVIGIQARPQFLALPALALWTDTLLAARGTNQAPSATVLGALMVIWANLHGSFVLGFVLFALFAAEAIVKGFARKRWLMVSAVILLAAMMTPEGFSGLLFPLKLMSMKSLALISEWKGLDFSSLEPFEIWLLAVLAFAFIRGVRISIVTATLFIGMLHETLAHRRYAVVLLVVGTMILAESFGRSLKKGPAPPRQPLPLSATLVTLGILLAVVVARLALPKPEPAGYHAFATAASHVPPDVRGRPVLNAWDFGGYMIFDGERPFIDGRADMYGDEFVETYVKAEDGNGETMKTILAQYAIAWTIFPPASRANRALDALGWPVLYRDASAVVHIRETIPPR